MAGRPKLTKEQREAKAEQTPAERFKEVASLRVSRTLDAIESVGKLAGGSNYEYTADQAEAIIGELTKAVEQVKTRFETKGEGGRARRFTLA